MALSVCCIFLVFSLVLAQDAVPLGVVCSACACADGRVDCAAKDIRSIFTVDEWKVLDITSDVDQLPSTSQHEFSSTSGQNMNESTTKKRKFNEAFRGVESRKRQEIKRRQLEDNIALKSFKPTEIDLSENHFTTLSVFPNLPIRNLTVSNSDVEMIEAGCFKHLTETLVSLDLSNNKITTTTLDKRVFLTVLNANNEFTHFKSMQYLSLARNDIHSLPKDLFMAMPELTHLDLSGNPMAYIDAVTLATISDLTKLKNLTLSSCDLETIPEGMFRRLRRLQGLDLSGNRFTTIPAKINEAINLLYLNLDRNPLETIDDNTPFSKLVKLKELYIRRCSKLKSVAAGALGHLESLSILDISHNPRLSVIDKNFLVWLDQDERERHPMVKELYLNNNNLTEISSYYLDRWSLLENGDFTNNPYDCDCDSQWMVDVLVPLLTELPTCVDELNYMTCKSPEPYRGLTYSQLVNSSRTLACTGNLETPVTDSAIMLGIMIGVFVTFPMVILTVLLWKRGIFSKCRKKTDHREEEEDMF